MTVPSGVEPTLPEDDRAVGDVNDEIELLLKQQSVALPAGVVYTDWISGLERASASWNKVIAGFGGVLIVIGVVVTVVDVVGRYVFLSPLPGALELQQILLGYIALMPIAHALISGDHVRFMVLLQHTRGRTRAVFEIIAAIVGIAFSLALILGGFTSFLSSWRADEMMPAQIPLPYWLPKAMLPLAGTLFVVQLVIVILRQITLIRHPLPDTGPGS